MLKRINLLLISFVFILISTSSAWCITIEYSGRISGKGSNTAGELDKIYVGESIQGSFSYDQYDSSDTNGWSVVGNYPFSSTNSSMNLNISNKVSESGYIDHIHISDNWSYPNYPTIDTFTLIGNFSIGQETMEIFLRFQNRDSNLNQIISDNLLDVPLDFSAYSLVNGTVTNKYRSMSYVTFDVFAATFTDSPAPVPEPGTVVLLGAGFAGFFTYRRIAKK